MVKANISSKLAYHPNQMIKCQYLILITIIIQSPVILFVLVINIASRSIYKYMHNTVNCSCHEIKCMSNPANIL